jgi:DNA-binding CsgD family transcriptional regulator
MRGFSDSILTLYRSARVNTQAEFQAQAFQTLYKYTRFQRARWRVGLSAPHGLVIRTLGVSTSALCQADESLCTDEPGLPQDSPFIYGESFLYLPETLGVWQWFIERDDAPSVDEPATRPLHPLVLTLSISRDRRDQRFSADEREAAQSLHKHISEAWSINLYVSLQRHHQQRLANHHAAAIVTCDGTLLFGDGAFMHCLAQEWPLQDDAVLPPALLKALGAGDARYVGKSHVFHFLREGVTVHVRVRRKLAVDSLSMRELQVARHVAAGLTYKEIARVLGIAPSTVRKQIVSVHERMSVRNNAELAARIGPVLAWLQIPEAPMSPAKTGTYDPV